MKTTCFVILAFACVAAAAAEPQRPERIEYRGELLYMYATPLDSFFSAANPKPDEMLEARPSSCLRGYRGTWEIADGNLRLVSVRVFNVGAIIPLPLRMIDPKWEAPVNATWFTGPIRIGSGKKIRGWSSVGNPAEGGVVDLTAEIRNGRVVSVRETGTPKIPNKSE